MALFMHDVRRTGLLMPGWDLGNHNGTFLLRNVPYKAHIFRETNFGHRSSDWLIINVKAQSIIVQSLYLFVKHVGSAFGCAMGLHSSLRTSCVSRQGRIGLDRNLCPKQMNPWRCCFSRKHIRKLNTIKTNQGYGQTFIKLFRNEIV